MAKQVIRGEEILSKAAISIYNGTEGDIPPLKIKEITGTIEMDKPVTVFQGIVNSISRTITIAQTLVIKLQDDIGMYIKDICWVKIQYNAFSIPFDDRGIIYNLPEDILLIINEQLKIDRRPYHLQVVPLKYTDYAKQMTKPFKYPPKNTCWRLVQSGSGIDNRQAEIIVNPNVSIVDYRIKYIKRPMPIILAPLAGLTIEGDSGDGHTAEKQGSELDLILHPSILQRAVELAKAAYIGDLQTTVSLGAASQTDIGQQLRQQQ